MIERETNRIATGEVDQYVYVNMGVAGLVPANFTIRRAGNGATSWTTFGSPTVAEVDATDAPGWYAVLINEGTTLGAGNASEAMVVEVAYVGVPTKYLDIELFDPAEFGSGGGNGAPATGTLTGVTGRARSEGVDIHTQFAATLVRAAESAFVIGVTYKDDAGATAIPSSIEYQVWGVDGDAVVQAYLPVLAQDPETFFLVPATALAIIDSANERETRKITIRANDGENDEQNINLFVEIQAN